MSSRRKRRTLVELVLAFSLLLGVSYAQVATTQVTETVYHADGTAAAGTLLVNWPSFTAASGAAVPAGSTSITIGAGGAMSASLVPNAGATPMGSYYTVVYHLDDGSTTREYWVVPVSAYPVQVSTIKSSVLPLSVAMQTVSKAYVDTAIVTAGSQPVAAGRLPVFTASGVGHAAGAVPDPGATPGTTRYLREDGAWASPLPVMPAGVQCEFLYAGVTSPAFTPYTSLVGGYQTTFPLQPHPPAQTKAGLVFTSSNANLAKIDKGCLDGAQTLMLVYTTDVTQMMAQSSGFGVVLANDNFRSLQVHGSALTQGMFDGQSVASLDRVTGTTVQTEVSGSAEGSGESRIYTNDAVFAADYGNVLAPAWSSATTYYLGGLDASGTLGWSGTLHALVAWPTQLTPAQIHTAYQAISQTLAPYGVNPADKTDYSQGAVVFWGDSINEDYGDKYIYGGGVAPQAMAMLGLNLPWYNVAHYGDRTDQMLAKFPGNVGSIFKLYGASPRIAIGDSGSNDLTSGFTNTAILASTTAICASAVALSAQCAISTVLPRNDISGAGETQRQALNAAYRTGVLNGSLNAASLVDWATDPVMGNINTPSNPAYYQTDAIHPTTLGGQILARYDALALHRLLSPATPYWTKVSANSVAFAGINRASYTMPLLQLMPKEKVCGLSARVGTALAGTGLTGLTATLGDSLGTATTYGASFNALVAGVEDNGAPTASPGETGMVQAYWTATGGNLSAVSAGTVDFNICVVTQP